MRRLLAQTDSGFSTLLEDLSEHGLLDSTIVWWGGEFGRTPKIQWEAERVGMDFPEREERFYRQIAETGLFFQTNYQLHY